MVMITLFNLRRLVSGKCGMLHLFLLQGGLVNVLGTMESRYLIDDVVGLFTLLDQILGYCDDYIWNFVLV